MLSRGKIKKINSLKDKKTRQISQLFTIEGIKSVKEISLSAFITIEELYAVPEFHALASSIAPGRTEEISPEDMRRISSQTTPEGLLAVCRIPNHGHFAFKEGQLVIALDDIRDPGNLGTIVRLADWFGVEDILCSKSTVDLYNPKTVQSTMGSMARVRVHYTDLAETLARCPLKVYGAFLEGSDIYRANLKPEGVIVIGNEANGISPAVEAVVSEKITIPRFGRTHGAESLNAAIAASVIISQFISSTHGRSGK